ncbi:unnamed protein product, partial [Meganyctiphanes norvegica]
ENISGSLVITPTVLVIPSSSAGDAPERRTSRAGRVWVKAEEVGIVLLVLAVWMFAIVLFINRWGKIRMLEPYQEPYKEPPPILAHRASCPMADSLGLPISKCQHGVVIEGKSPSSLGNRPKTLQRQMALYDCYYNNCKNRPPLLSSLSMPQNSFNK